jgi:type IV pilus assembly protein PilE
MKRSQRGVTLMELLVVMAIIGIIASIAVPSYRRYLVRANRTDAKTALLQTAQALERCYTNSVPYAYNSATCAAAVVLPLPVASGNYIVDVSGPGITPQAFTISATPQGSQAAEDAACATFTLTQAGVQTVSGTSPPDLCWRR